MPTNNNSHISAIVFDLDGTLVSSHKTIYNTTVYTLDKLGIPHNMNEDDFNLLIGLHFQDIFDKLSVEVNDLEYFISIYKGYYFDFIDDSVVYPGVYETLQFLKERGYSIGLLTTKGDDQAKKIAGHFGFDKFISSINGRKPGVKIKPDPEPLRLICEEFGEECGKTMMVGDSEMDIQCGKNAGAKTCAVTFGYRSFAQIKSENPDYIIDHFTSLKNILKG